MTPRTGQERPPASPEKFRRKPTVVEAQQFLGPAARPIPPGVCLGDGECMHGARFTGFGKAPYPPGRWGGPHVTTAQLQHVSVAPGEWIIRESDGQHFYPCKPDVFAATYEPAHAAPQPEATGPAISKAGQSGFDDLMADYNDRLEDIRTLKAAISKAAEALERGIVALLDTTPLAYTHSRAVIARDLREALSALRESTPGTPTRTK